MHKARSLTLGMRTILVLVFLGCLCARSQADRLFVTTFDPQSYQGTIIALDPDMGPTGQFPVPVSLADNMQTGLAYSNGVLYFAAAAPVGNGTGTRIWALDPDTGNQLGDPIEVEEVTTFGLAALGGHLYLGEDIVKVDPATGQKLGSLDPSGYIGGLGSLPNENMLLATTTTWDTQGNMIGQIVKIDPVSGAMTQMGEGYPGFYGAGICSVSDAIYAVGQRDIGSGMIPYLTVMDLSGNELEQTQTPDIFLDVAGEWGAASEDPVIPEPLTLGLLGAGMAGLGGYVRRRRA